MFFHTVVIQAHLSPPSRVHCHLSGSRVAPEVGVRSLPSQCALLTPASVAFLLSVWLQRISPGQSRQHPVSGLAGSEDVDVFILPLCSWTCSLTRGAGHGFLSS